MVRFCDREVDCVEYSSLTRAGILAYFLPDHKEDMLCVYDSFDAMGYVGVITYDSFKNSLSVNGAIKQEYVILNTDIWKNAREYFRYREKELMVDRLLPVLDEEYRLICFAYEDVDANREIRMLRELSEHSEALQFQIYIRNISVSEYMSLMNWPISLPNIWRARIFLYRCKERCGVIFLLARNVRCQNMPV